MPKRRRKVNQLKRRGAPASTRGRNMRMRVRALALARAELVAFQAMFAPHFVRAEQQAWSAFYLCGQLSNLGRKTIEPLVLALLGTTAAAIRAVQQFIGQSPWATAPVFQQLERLVNAWLGEPQGIIIADGSGFPKRGGHSAGVAWQYCGRLGKVENCQAGVFLVYASSKGQAFLRTRLYLPAEWFAASHARRWQHCGIPADQVFQTEPMIALALLQEVVAHGQVPFRWVTADEDFGRDPSFLDGIAALDKWYLAEIPKNTRVWLRTPTVQPPGPSLIGRARLRPRVTPNAPAPPRVDDIAAQLPARRWKRCPIGHGARGPQWAEFCWLRVTSLRQQLPGPRQWLLIQRNLDEARTLKYYLSNAPAQCAPVELIRLSGYRWPIETALEEAKGEVGMAHYETRSWVGWHHHMAQTFMAHLFLVRLQQQLQKKSSHNARSGAPLDRPSHCRRIPRWA